MKKLLLLTTCLIVLISCPVFGYYYSDFSQSSSTTGWSAQWSSGKKSGTIILGWGSGGYSGNCLHVYVNKTTSFEDNVQIFCKQPPFTLGKDTVWSLYALGFSNELEISVLAQPYTQQGPKWTWVTAGGDVDGFSGDISTTWQQFTIFNNDKASGTPMEVAGIQFVLGVIAGKFEFCIDNALLGPGLTPQK